MKEHTVKLYSISELTGDARKKALEHFEEINSGYGWWDCTFEDAKMAGITILQFDIDLDFIKGDFDKSGIFTAHEIIDNHGKSCDTHKTALKYVETFNSCLTDEDSEQADQQFLKDILSDYLKMLKSDFEYLISEAAIVETIEANDYSFTEDGKYFNF